MTEFKNISIENFCGIDKLNTSLYQRTVVSGKNAVGKSTVKKAIQYALNTRDDSGREIAGIRPHDADGADVDGLLTAVEITVSSNGDENVFRKEFYLKKNRKGEYTGENETVYYIDGVKKNTKRAYDMFVQSIVPAEICINANALLAKDTAGRREMLKVFQKHNANDVIAENPQFNELRGKLKANSVSDLKKACRERIGGRGRNARGGLEDELKRIGIEIDVLEGKKTNIDVAELELARNGLKEQIAEIEEKEAGASKQCMEYQKLSDGILELKFQLSDLARKANEECAQKRSDIRQKIGIARVEISDAVKKTQAAKRDIARLTQSIKKAEGEVSACRDEWGTANERVFDESSLVCAYCGQEYPPEKKEQIQAEFEAHKAEELSRITVKGQGLNAQIDKDKALVEEAKSIIRENEASKELLENEIGNLEKEMGGMPDKIDISDTDEYKSIQSKIKKKESAMKKESSADEAHRKLKEQKEDLQAQLFETNTQIALSQKDVEIDEKISDLQKRRAKVNQQIADSERELDLLTEFERAYARALEKDVNGYFEYAQVKMFDTYQNGEIKDVCEFIHDGTSYDRGLNHGARMLVEVDICRAFQKLYGACCPIIVDDAESLDEDRIPDVENQLLILRRTDGKKLEIKEGL